MHPVRDQQKARLVGTDRSLALRSPVARVPTNSDIPSYHQRSVEIQKPTSSLT
jgi:hypothetical protein